MPIATDRRARSHLQAMAVSGRLTQYWRDLYRPTAAAVSPAGVLKALHQAGVRPVLIGAHGLGGWRSRARATHDVGVLVRMKDLRKAVRALQAAYPTLLVKDTPVVTRFIDPAIDDVVIDLMKPTQRIYSMVFRHTISAGKTHDIPDLEMALVSKFAAMRSPLRAAEGKMQDGGDFINMVKHNRGEIDLCKLKRLATKVYPDGGTEIVSLLEDIDAGRTIQV